VFSHRADLSDGNARFGESSVAGNWAGAGTNGNVDLLMLDISCGVTPGLVTQEYSNAFAGAHLISTVMPTELGSDTLDIPDRGAIVGNDAWTHIDSSAAIAWADSINSIGGSACNNGGGGLSGCGANFSFTVAQSYNAVEYFANDESWANLQYDSDATGDSYISWVYQCNYDCATYPITY
jgi:hypothetical protein